MSSPDFFRNTGFLAAQDYFFARERVPVNLRFHVVIALGKTAHRFPVALANR